MKQTKSIQDVVKPLQIISWTLGSGIIEIPIGRPRFLITFFYSLIILTTYAISLYYTTIYENYMYLKKLNSTGEFLIKIIILGNAFLSLIAVILAWNRRKVYYITLRGLANQFWFYSFFLNRSGTKVKCSKTHQIIIIHFS